MTKEAVSEAAAAAEVEDGAGEEVSIFAAMEKAERDAENGVTEPPETEQSEGEAAAETEKSTGKTEKSGKGAKSEGDKTDDASVKTVPHQALHAEREEHKKTRSELSEVKQRQQLMEQRWQMLMQSAQQPPQEKKDDTPPDPNEDVFAALKWTQDQLLAAKQANQQALANQQMVQQQRQAIDQAWSHWQASVQDYSHENPDFADAARFLNESRHNELAQMARINPTFGSPQGRNAQIEADLLQIVAMALQNGQSPAAVIHDIAVQRGYRKADAAAQGQEQADQTAVDKIAQIAKAQQASKTVAQAPGKAGGDEMTLEALLNLPDDQFDTWRKANGAKYRQMLGAGG